MIAGESRSGKHEIADGVLPRGHRARVALGDRLRDVVCSALPVARLSVTDAIDRPLPIGMTGRQVLVAVATLLREVDPVALVRPVIARLADAAAAGEPIACVPDLRSPVDLAELRAWSQAAGHRLHVARVSRSDRRPSALPYDQLAQHLQPDQLLSCRGQAAVVDARIELLRQLVRCPEWSRPLAPPVEQLEVDEVDRAE